MPSKESFVDEAMIAYNGRPSFKQYLPAKPKFGGKVWVRADPNNGYVNTFNVYTGTSEQTMSGEGGLRERVVKKNCPNVWMVKIMSMNNFFLTQIIHRNRTERHLSIKSIRREIPPC